MPERRTDHHDDGTVTVDAALPIKGAPRGNDTFDVLDRFPTPYAVHGGPKFSPDGRYVFVMSRDG